MKKLTLLFTALLLMSFSVFAQEIPVDAPIEPAFEFFKQLLGFLISTFPTTGKYIQGAGEIIGALATFFTLATVFVQSVLGIPYLLARWAEAHELADKIKKLSDKVTPFFKYLSIFNVTKKK